MQEIRNYGIKIYQFPDAEDDEDESQANKKLKVCSFISSLNYHLVIRREFHSLLLVVTQLWRLVVRRYVGVYTHGALQKWIALIIVILLYYVTC